MLVCNFASWFIASICLDLASQVDYRDRDCVFVAILSHGEEGMVYGTDKPVSYDNLFEPFKNSKSLVGKPKIFVMQVDMFYSTFYYYTYFLDNWKINFSIDSLAAAPLFIIISPRLKHIPLNRLVEVRNWIEV